MKKLRCDIAGNSCEKCIEASVTCSYNNNTRGGSESRSSCSADGEAQRPGSPPTGECISVVSKPDIPPAPSCLSSPATHTRHTGTPPPGPTHIDFGDKLTGSNDFQGDDPASTLIDSAIATPSFMADLGVWMKSGLSHDINGFDATSSQSGDLIHGFDICYCVDRIISANATMQTKLLWATSLNGCSTSSIDDMLQCQKNVLASCGEFLECSKCSLKSDYMVLVISMCREMVSGIKTLEHITSPEPSAQQCASRRTSHPSSSTERSSGKGNNLGAGGWHLDDEDEMEIIQNLIQVRIRKLKKLVDQLEVAVITNHASYAWIVCGLRDVLDGKLP
ncbi:hypothetical protein PG995_014193 [Apiospora arundinis]